MPEIDQYLRGQVSQLQNLVVQLDQTVGAVHQEVSVVGQRQAETRDELTQLRDEFRAFVRTAELTANIQRAETKIGVLADRLDHEFGHHKVVRNSARGILQAFDAGLVTQASVQAISEQLMIQTPRYWLAPILVAMAAWAGDDRDLCDRAVTEAFHRDPEKTSLFMALVTRRQGRMPAAVRWLKHYLAKQDPTALGRDFAVILESVAQGAFGPAAVELVRAAMDRWRARLLDEEHIQDAQVARWRGEIEAHVAGSSAGRFGRLAAVTPQWPQLDRGLACAGAHRALLDKYTAMLAEEPVTTDRVEDAVDEILERLVQDFDGDELPLRRELLFNDAVVDNGGDLAAAQRSVDSTAALDETLDYLTIQSESALNPAVIGVSRSTQRIAVSACAEWFARAHAGFTRDYRMALPASVQAVFDAAHNPMAQVFALPTWTGSFTEPMPALERSLAAHWDRHGQGYIASFAYDWQKRAWIAGASALGALVLLSLCFHVVLGFVVALAGGGIWALVIHTEYQAGLKRQEEARALIERSKLQSLQELRGANAELADWTTAFQAADRMEPQVRELIGQLSTAGNAPTRFEQRVVRGD